MLLRKNNKKIDSSGYLIGAIMLLLVTLAFTYPVAPLFLKWFVPFPALEDATVYEGVLHIKGGKKTRSRRTKSFSTAPTYYIIDKQGEAHKVFFGYLGNEHAFYSEIDEGTKIKVWFHPLYGVINKESYASPRRLELFPQKKGVLSGGHYEADREYFEQRFDYEKYYWRALSPLSTLAFTIYYFIRYRQLRKKERAEQAS